MFIFLPEEEKAMFIPLYHYHCCRADAPTPHPQLNTPVSSPEMLKLFNKKSSQMLLKNA